MNNKQKLGYMALGAGILALGITIGQWTTPNIEAQNNGVFDEIQCSKLTVVDEAGKRAILLYGGEEFNGIFVFNPLMNEPKGIELMAMKSGNRVFVNDRKHNRVITIASVEEGNGVTLFNQSGKMGIQLSTGELGNRVDVLNEQGNSAIELSTSAVLPTFLNGIKIYNEAGKIKWFAP